MFKKPASACQKKILSPTIKAKMETKLVEESGMPDQSQSLGKVDTGKDCPGARLGIFNPIRNELRRLKVFIKSGSTRAETGRLVG